jgi:hypothetical protein
VAETVPVIVTVAHPDKIDDVSAASKARGMTHVSILRSLGLIKGLVDAKAIDVIARIEGVQSVERERQFKLPDPRSPVQ